MQSFYGMNQEELALLLSELGQPHFRVKQLLDWVYRKHVRSWDDMVNIPKALREQLAERLSLEGSPCLRVQDSDDRETRKFLWQLAEGQAVESVLIMSEERRTVCVSSQVGCPARCAFCASGKQGWKSNLTAGQIVSQVLQIDDSLRERGERVTNVVFMGMGEPLLNLEAVIKAIHILTDPDLVGMSQRRLTVSTVGIVDGIRRMTEEKLKVKLVLSLHAPNQHIRKKIIPTARQYPLEDILEAMDAYAAATKRDITYEYILINELNDGTEHAEELAQLVKRRQCTVNLIPYNPVPGLRLKRPSGSRVARFRRVLQQRRIINTCRYTKGDDIAAACGQLALQEQKVEERFASPLG